MTINQGAHAKQNNKAYLSQTGGFHKFRGEYIDTTETTVSPKKHSKDLKGSPLRYFEDQVQVKPKLLESGLAHKPEF